MKIFLKHKASVNVKDYNGCTPLYLAAKFGNYEITKTLVAQPDCDIHTTDKVLHFVVVVVEYSTEPVAHTLMGHVL